MLGLTKPAGFFSDDGRLMAPKYMDMNDNDMNVPYHPYLLFPFISIEFTLCIRSFSLGTTMDAARSFEIFESSVK